MSLAAAVDRKNRRCSGYLAAQYFTSAFVVLLSASLSAAEDANWPQWRGPLGTGAAPTAKPPVRWSESEHIQWKIQTPGAGMSTPIVWGNQIFLQTAIVTKVVQEESAKDSADDACQENSGQETTQSQESTQPMRRRRGGGGRGGFGIETPKDKHQFTVLSIDRQTGKTLWQRTAREEVPHEGHHRDHSFASYSPVTDGKHVLVSFGSRGLYCYDLNGNLQWEKDLGDMQTKNAFGEGSSPALHENTVVINWDHEGDDFIVALDKTTGEERWRQPRDEDTTWATPLIVEHEGRAQVVTAATNRVRSYDLASGKQIWECEGLTPNAIPTPVAGEGIVYLTSGFRGSKLLAIRLGHEGDLTDTDAIVWTHGRSTPYVPSPLLVDNKLYFYASNNGILSCFDAQSGKMLMEPTRVEGLQGVYASPVAADGKIYLVGRTGVTVVIEATDTLKILATNQLDDRFDASPAIVGNQLFLRGHQHLYCIAEE